MRLDCLLRWVAVGLSLAVLPAAHAARPGGSSLTKNGQTRPKVKKKTEPNLSGAEAARAILEARVELSKMTAAPKAPGLALLVERQYRLDRGHSPVPILKKGGVALSVYHGKLCVTEGDSPLRVAGAADLLKLGINNQKDFERVIEERFAEIARGIKGEKGKDAQETVRKDMEVSHELMTALGGDRIIWRLGDYQKEVRVASGLAPANERLVLATGQTGSLVLNGYGVRWRDEKGLLNSPTRADLAEIGVKNADDFRRILTARLFKLVGMKGNPNREDAVAEATKIYDRERREIAQLEKMILSPHANEYLALVGKSRVDKDGRGAKPVVLMKQGDERLEYAAEKDYYDPITPIVVVDARGMRKRATVADLRRFKIDNAKAFKQKAETLYREHIDAVARLNNFVRSPHSNPDLALVAQSRVALKGPLAEPIVLLEQGSERLEFKAAKDSWGSSIEVVNTAVHRRRDATVNDLWRFKIDTAEDFNALARQMLTKEVKEGK